MPRCGCLRRDGGWLLALGVPDRMIGCDKGLDDADKCHCAADVAHRSGWLTRELGNEIDGALDCALCKAVDRAC